jgi:hypothetical protein
MLEPEIKILTPMKLVTMSLVANRKGLLWQRFIVPAHNDSQHGAQLSGRFEEAAGIECYLEIQYQ